LVDDEGQVPGAGKQPLDAAAEKDRAAAAGAAPPMSATTFLHLASDGSDGPSTYLRDIGDSSDNPAVCPFLRATVDGGLDTPIETPDPSNRCTAIGQPTPQSGRQQELVCLTQVHINCPRYLRGVVAMGTPPEEPAVRSGPSIAVVAAAIVLAVSASLSVGFLLVRGGFDLALASPSPGQVAVVAPTTAPTIFPRPTRAPSPSPVPSELPSVVPTPSPSPVVSPTPPPTPAPTAVPTARPTPRSDRYALLEPCPSTPKCWIYTVRSGDNLTSIVNWFGVAINKVRSMNPNLANPIRAGDKIRMPPPTR
jgi:hypothetical protein